MKKEISGYGFVYWQPTENKWSTFLPQPGSQTQLAHASIRGLAYDGKYLIIGPTDQGLWLFNIKTRKYKRPLYFDEDTKKWSNRDFIDAITTLQNGDHLILGRDMIYVLDGKTYQLKKLDVSFNRENSNGAYQGGNGIIWITTQKGLYCLNESLQFIGKAPLNAPDDIVHSGMILDDNQYLFSTNSGLYKARYNRGKVSLAKITTVFDNLLLTVLYRDKSGTIWAGTENGIYQYHPATQNLAIYDYSDNVQSYGFNTDSWLLTHNGQLFFGSTNGMNYWNPNMLDKTKESLKFYINKVKFDVNDSTIYNFDKELHIDYKHRSVEIGLSTVYFNNPDKVRYRYRLEGLDTTWKYIEQANLLRFTSLPPGNYQFRVQASTNNTIWIDSKNELNFTIETPFWLTWWFRILITVSVVTVIWSIIRNRNKTITRQREQIEQEHTVNYFASSMHDHQNEDDILWDIVKNCIGRLKFEDSVIYLIDEERKCLIQKAAYGPKSSKMFEIVNPLEIPLGKGITGAVALSGKAEIIDDTSKDPRYIVDDERRYSEITVPLIANGKVLGVFDCEHSKKRFFTQRHLSILTTIASLCANKIVKARVEEEKRLAEQHLMDTKNESPLHFQLP
jgi:putative methionine-R-sulfoxide reductase with GAF domain